jgi:hypothetical protein
LGSRSKQKSGFVAGQNIARTVRSFGNCCVTHIPWCPGGVSNANHLLGLFGYRCNILNIIRKNTELKKIIVSILSFNRAGIGEKVKK